MGWERRRKGRYFYLSVRTPDGPRKVYLGGGPLGEMNARLEARRRRERAAARAEWIGRRLELEAADRLLDRTAGLLRLLIAARLLLGGYHRGHRHWRRRRVPEGPG
jgi:hypothetical protein